MAAEGGAGDARLRQVFEVMDASFARYVEHLREAVAIQSVSADPAKRPECLRMVEAYRAESKWPVALDPRAATAMGCASASAHARAGTAGVRRRVPACSVYASPCVRHAAGPWTPCNAAGLRVVAAACTAAVRCACRKCPFRRSNRPARDAVWLTPALCVCVPAWRRAVTRLGVESELRELGSHVVDGVEVPLPPVIVGRYGARGNGKRTVCAYGHLDVQPARKEDGWDTEPFELTEVAADAADDAARGYGAFPSEGKLYGRGSTDDKGPALAWLWAIEAYAKAGQELPVNLLFLVECMEESSSVGLDAVVRAEFADAGYLADA